MTGIHGDPTRRNLPKATGFRREFYETHDICIRSSCFMHKNRGHPSGPVSVRQGFRRNLAGQIFKQMIAYLRLEPPYCHF